MKMSTCLRVLAALCVCVGGTDNTHVSHELKEWKMAGQPVHEQLALIYREVESLRCEQAALKHKQEALSEVLTVGMNDTSIQTDSSSLLYPFTKDVVEEDSVEEDHMYDPCFRYTALDQPWRATNYSRTNSMCDRKVEWRGWYRLYYHGKSLQMPERCVSRRMCGTHAPLWLAGGHPRLRDGIVIRQVCGHWKKGCCAYKSSPIEVKKCRGNYYVYRFVKPPTCNLAYCADVNTLVCGTCKKNEICVSRDKVSWRCKKLAPKVRVFFYASFPGRLSGKVNTVKYSKVFVNVGGGFSKRTGVFTAPVTGVYQFFFSTHSGTGGTKSDLWLVINGYWVSQSHISLPTSSSTGNLSTYMTTLRKGSRVYVTHNYGQSWANTSSNTITFGGSLLMQQR